MQRLSLDVCYELPQLQFRTHVERSLLFGTTVRYQLLRCWCRCQHLNESHSKRTKLSNMWTWIGNGEKAFLTGSALRCSQCSLLLSRKHRSWMKMWMSGRKTGRLCSVESSPTAEHFHRFKTFGCMRFSRIVNSEHVTTNLFEITRKKTSL